MSDACFEKRLLVASGNRHKILELQTVAEGFGLELYSPQSCSAELGLGEPPEVEETGDTYRENALLKAKAYAKWSGRPALADDSGLEVDALGGQPGVHSARYAGEDASAGEKIEKLLHELSLVEREKPGVSRSARFRCYLILAYPNGAFLSAESSLEGHILKELRGEKGFGYDPIVFIDSIGKTLAEVDFEVTCSKGFRAQAARDLFSQLVSLKGL